MKLGVHVGYWGLGLSAEDQLAIVTEAERLGYDSVWAAEAYGSDAATILAWIAGQTSRIRIGSAIFQMPARSAAMTAMTAATLDQLSGGRMILGIGSSGPQVAEGWHGQRFARQIQRTREYVAVVRMALARERVEFHGETLELPLPDGPGRALKLTIAPVQDRIPIYLAAIGPNNTRLAGEIADGWIPTLFSPEHVAEFRPLLEQGAARARRDAAVPRALRGRDGLARAQLLQPARPALRLRGRGAGRPGPVPRRQAPRGGGGAARRAHRPRLAVRAGRPRPPGALPRVGRRHARGEPDGLGPRGAAGAAAPRRRACRSLTSACGCCWAPSATPATPSR